FLIAGRDQVLGSSRDSGETKSGRIFDWGLLTQKGNPPPNPIIREDLTIEHFREALDREAWNSRLLAFQRAVREKRVALLSKLKQSRESALRARGEPDWQREADHLKAQLGTVKTAADVVGLKVNLDPKLDLSANLEALYRNAKRKKRRIGEAEIRAEDATAALARLEGLEVTDWATLASAETALIPGSPAVAGGSSTKKRTEVGKIFRSSNGALIRLGRNSKENLEVTFRAAKGNDLWLHVRGKPSAHAVIHLSPGKSAALETLLDAAMLVLHFSKGADWGKTEVDYTFRKNVKRIKDSTQVSYTGNKTLIVTLDPVRLARLLASEAI
ncbi:MAG: NFACT RNA binding domain-containing protein, partial [Bdellovibrionota bacterium]